MRAQEPRSWIGLLALAFLVAVTVAWWALALWPAGDAEAEWLARARYVCFNVGANGLPDASGWLLLIGQPIGTLAALMVVWGREVRSGLRALGRSAWGRATLALCVAALIAGLGAAGERVASGVARGPSPLVGAGPPDSYPRLDRRAPRLSLRDQHGTSLDWEQLRGRPALVTFAFGNCESVCPAVVKQTLDARRALRERARAGEVERDAVPRVVILSLDPWRDTPGRLGHLAHHWELDAESHLLSGEVEAVEAVLDAWDVPRQRDRSTGDIAHPPLVYIVDREGDIAFATRGDTDTLTALLTRL